MKCRFWKQCENYDEDSLVCTRNAGMYYGDHTRPAGCYIEQANKNYKII